MDDDDTSDSDVDSSNNEGDGHPSDSDEDASTSDGDDDSSTSDGDSDSSSEEESLELYPVGTRVSKVFDGIRFDGKVISHDKNRSKFPYRVHYKNYETEDLNIKELTEAVKEANDLRPMKKVTARRRRKNRNNKKDQPEPSSKGTVTILNLLHYHD